MAANRRPHDVLVRVGHDRFVVSDVSAWPLHVDERQARGRIAPRSQRRSTPASELASPSQLRIWGGNSGPLPPSRASGPKWVGKLSWRACAMARRSASGRASASAHPS